MSRYTANDHTTHRGRRAVAYDRLRESGIPRETALRVAAQAAEKQPRVEDSAGGPRRAPLTSAPSGANPYRVPFDWER